MRGRSRDSTRPPGAAGVRADRSARGSVHAWMMILSFICGAHRDRSRVLSPVPFDLIGFGDRRDGIMEGPQKGAQLGRVGEHLWLDEQRPEIGFDLRLAQEDV